MELNYTDMLIEANYTFTKPQVNRTLPNMLPCTDLHIDTEGIIFTTFLVLVLLLAILGNALVCIAVCLSPKLRENPTNYFVISLAVSDMCFAIFQAPMKISMKLNRGIFCFDINVCWMMVLSDLIATPATIITLFVIAADRYYCINKPFLYQERISKRKARYMVAVIWASACVVASLFTFKWNDPSKPPLFGPGCATDNKFFYLMLNILLILIPLIIMGIMYSVILRIAISHIRAIKNSALLGRNDENENSDRRLSKSSHRRTHRELRATGTLAMVYGAFVICWLPICILNIIMGIRREILIATWKKMPEIFVLIFDVLPMLSTVVNPIIYNFSNKQFRMAFKVVMYRLVGKSEILRRATVIKEFGTYGKKGAGFYSTATMEMHKINGEQEKMIQ